MFEIRDFCRRVLTSFNSVIVSVFDAGKSAQAISAIGLEKIRVKKSDGFDDVLTYCILVFEKVAFIVSNRQRRDGARDF